jgi:hypothetical protein
MAGLVLAVTQGYSVPLRLDNGWVVSSVGKCRAQPANAILKLAASVQLRAEFATGVSHFTDKLWYPGQQRALIGREAARAYTERT